MDSKTDKKLTNSAAADIELLLSDDEFVDKYILSNPIIYSKFKASLIREIMESNAPATLRGGSGIHMRTPIHKPKNLAEAAQMTKNYLSKN